MHGRGRQRMRESLYLWRSAERNVAITQTLMSTAASLFKIPGPPFALVRERINSPVSITSRAVPESNR